MAQNGLQIRQLGQIAGAITSRLQQLYQPPPNRIEGVDPSNWPSALQPVSPIGPKGSEPLTLSYMMGQNLAYTPRGDAEYSAAALKALSVYPLARICIENVKDQLGRIPWEIQLKSQPGETKKEHRKRMKGDTLAQNLTKFFEYPDGEHNWSEWLRPVIEDMLVIDAASILIRRTKGGRIAQLVNIPGESITRYIDDSGFTPQPPSPAYAQLWEGIPRVDLTTDQLIYKPRNVVRRNTYASQLYGMSPVEQAAVEIQVGAARLAYVLAFYADGGIPNALQIVPSSANAKNIKDAMTWMASELAGNLAKRRKLFMTQGFTADGTDQVIFPPEPVLADAFDDLHIRKICFAFGTSPQRLMRMMNRASANANQEASEEEGLLPWMEWVAGVINYAIQRKAGYVDYEISFNPYQELDVVKLAAAQTQLVDNGLRTPDEGREAMGDDPSSEEGANQLGIKTATGRVPISLVTPAVTTEPGAQNVPGAPNAGAKAPKTPAMGADAAEKALQVLKYKYGCVMVAIPETSDAGRSLVAMRESIKPEHLQAKGLEKELHVTVRYGFSGDIEAIRNYLKQQPPFTISFGETFAFEPSENSDGAAPLCVKITSPDLERMNTELASHGTWKASDFDYHPHATLAYIDPRVAHMYVGLQDANGLGLEISNAVISEAYTGTGS